MKISKLYTNKPDLFEEINFNSGLNVILAEIKIPTNRGKDTHNLGKSTIGELINFCLLSGADSKHFLRSHDQFSNFEFYLEVALSKNSFLTIKRSVALASKASFKKHVDCYQDFTKLSDDEWDHLNVGFAKSKELLDSYLDLSSIAPLKYRNVIGYLLRAQTDYTDVFALSKFRGNHADWKPNLAKILGFDYDLISRCYEEEEVISILVNQEKLLLPENTSSTAKIGEIEGILALKISDRDAKERELASLDFSDTDKKLTGELVEQTNHKIQDLNKQVYYLAQNLARVDDSLSQAKIKFSIKEAESLFAEANILFKGQLKKDYQQLVEFNQEIISERHTYLLQEKTELIARIQSFTNELVELNKHRSELLKAIGSIDILARYRYLADELAMRKAEIMQLDLQRDALHTSREIRTNIRESKKILSDLISQLEDNLEVNIESQSESLFALVRKHFGEIIEQVLSRQAMLNVSLNNENHLEFTAQYLDVTGNKTSADKGHSYKKLLCIAFDLALLKSYKQQKLKFPRFVFHDGVFETLDDRKRENLLEIIRQYADDGIQQIITLIDSDAPSNLTNGSSWFTSEEVVLKLNDLGESGRLFKLPSW